MMMLLPKSQAYEIYCRDEAKSTDKENATKIKVPIINFRMVLKKKVNLEP